VSPARVRSAAEVGRVGRDETLPRVLAAPFSARHGTTPY